jgi:hypothetical protein
VVEGSATAPETPHPPPKKSNLRPPWKPGQSGNPRGRPPREPRVRRYARRFDRAMCKVLAELAQNPKVPPSERRRAAMDLIAVGSGRPALVQEIAGKEGQPLVGVNFNMGMSTAGAHGRLSPEQAYRLMVEGVIEATGDHPAFKALEHAAPAEAPSDTTDKESA